MPHRPRSKFISALKKATKPLFRSKVDQEDESSKADSNFPTVKQHDLTQKNQLLSSQKAIQAYGKYMVSINYLEREEVKDFSSQLRKELKSHKLFLQDELQMAKEDFRVAKKTLLYQHLKPTNLFTLFNKEERRDLSTTLIELKEDIETAKTELTKKQALLNNFKSDKTEFLIDYINCEIHGQNWQGKS